MGLKELYYGIEDKYYAFINWLAAHGLDLHPLINAIESHGIPSMPLFFALILVIIGGIFLYVNPGALQGLGGAQLTIRVQSAGGPVDGALVSLSGAGINQSSLTVNGAASFSGIGEGTRLRVTVTKQGFTAITRDIVAGAALGPFLLQAGREQVTLLVVDEAGSPVSNAQVSYVVNGETRNTVADSHGIAKLSATVGVEVELTIAAQGFDVHRESFTPSSANEQHQVTLERVAGRISNFDSLRSGARRVPSPNDDADTDASRSVSLAGQADVEVTVLNATGTAISGADVTLYNQADASVVGHGSTNAEGKFTFQDISTGIQA